jgi:hypothetical protein
MARLATTRNRFRRLRELLSVIGCDLFQQRDHFVSLADINRREVE